MPVPNTFASATSAIPLANLDTNFATPITLGNTAVQLGNTITTINSVTLVTPTINTITSGSGSNLVLQSNNAVTAVTIDTAQNVGVGVTPSATTTGAKSFEIGKVGSGLISFSQTQFGLASNYAYVGTADTFAGTGYASIFQNINGVWRWYTSTASGTSGNPATLTNTMTLDVSGNLLVGTNGVGANVGNGIAIRPAISGNVGDIDIGHSSGAASGSGYMQYAYNGAIIGNITQNGTTGVLYNVTSDYRLKNNPVPVTGAKDFVMSLQPKTWDWWDGSGKGVGFIAH